MFILDTDHLGILQRHRSPEYDQLVARMSTIDETDIYITIVSFHEQISGWAKYVKGAQDSSKVVSGYQRLEQIIQDFATAQVLPFSTAAAEIFDDLKRKKVRVATMDLRIASIAIAQRMTVITRNTVDFSRVPELQFVDWTV
jgi:tRNA(fMet)-specific endonuclease VapC